MPLTRDPALLQSQSAVSSRTMLASDAGQGLILASGANYTTLSSAELPSFTTIAIANPNNTAATITRGANCVLYKAGTYTDISSVTLAAAGLATLTKTGRSGSVDTWIISGNVS